MEKQKKAIRLNIYLTPKDRKILNEIRDKYHISYSTIAKVIMSVLMPSSQMLWMDHYFYKDTDSYKTCIKPRMDAINTIEFWNMYKSGGATIAYTNVIKSFTRNEIGKNTGWDEKECNKRRSAIYNRFQQEYDPNWNGNAFARQFSKFVKQNPEYTKKLLGEQD